ncbi:MAG: NAD(+) synthase, partial [Angelakisella sp.]
VKDKLLRGVTRYPFQEGRDGDDLMEIFDLQAGSLEARLAGSGISKLVIGVSGGLDSTLALLVSVRALEKAGLPPENL